MNASKAYAKAIDAMRPSAARMRAMHARDNAEANAMRDSVRAELAAGGEAHAMYHAARANGDKLRCVIVTGYLRRGAKALEHFIYKA